MKTQRIFERELNACFQTFLRLCLCHVRFAHRGDLYGSFFLPEGRLC